MPATIQKGPRSSDRGSDATVNAPDKPAVTIRLRHIAQLTGLSLGTISKVLNGREGVSAENREKVHQAVNDFGFRRWPMRGSAGPPLRSPTGVANSLPAC